MRTGTKRIRRNAGATAAERQGIPNFSFLFDTGRHPLDKLCLAAYREGFRKIATARVCETIWMKGNDQLEYIGFNEVPGSKPGDPRRWIRRPVTRQWAFDFLMSRAIPRELRPV